MGFNAPRQVLKGWGGAIEWAYSR